jgi:hypothetical protein
MPLNQIVFWTVIALLTAPIVIGVTIRAPKWVTLPLLAVIISFSSSTWGQLKIENTIYSRGSGMFYFSLLNIVLFVAGFGLLMQRISNRRRERLAPQIEIFFIGLVVLLLGHLAAGIWSGIDIPIILGYYGVINVLNMLIFMYLVIASIRTRRDQKDLIITIMLLAAVRAVFGLVRYKWFGGDPANPYGNFEGMNIKLVYFDVGDNFVASLGAFWACWMLTAQEFRLSLFKRLGLYAFLALEVATVVYSFRRSSLFGLVLMFVLLVFRISGAQRVKFLAVAGAITVAAGLVFFEQRMQYADKSHEGIIASMVYDVAPKKDGESGIRTYELMSAMHSVGSNWLTGLGTWGVFHGDEETLSFHEGNFSFIHSGFGHLILKTGLLGLLLFMGILFKFISYYLKHCNYLRKTERFLCDAGFASFLYWLPTLLVGTPIIEFRTMLFLGLTLALPFVAVHLQKRYSMPYAAA